MLSEVSHLFLSLWGIDEESIGFEWLLKQMGGFQAYIYANGEDWEMRWWIRVTSPLPNGCYSDG